MLSIAYYTSKRTHVHTIEVVSRDLYISAHCNSAILPIDNTVTTYVNPTIRSLDFGHHLRDSRHPWLAKIQITDEPRDLPSPSGLGEWQGHAIPARLVFVIQRPCQKYKENRTFVLIYHYRKARRLTSQISIAASTIINVDICLVLLRFRTLRVVIRKPRIHSFFFRNLAGLFTVTRHHRFPPSAGSLRCKAHALEDSFMFFAARLGGILIG